MIKKQLKKKVLTAFRPQVYSKHPTHDALRRQLPLLPFRSMVRLGSTTEAPNDGKLRIELNIPQGAINSGNKLRMKQCFTSVNVKTANWYTYYDLPTGGYLFAKNNNINVDLGIQSVNLPYPIISKSLHGSRGEGNIKHDTQQQLETWMQGKDLSNYIFEKYYTYSREYRLHVSDNGCFYTCRKLLRNDAPEGTWQRHDDVCVWVVEENEAFKKPANWDLIVQDCINALHSLNLEIGAFDVLVQGSSKPLPEWIICESCSAPSFGTITTQKYLEEIPKLLKQKYQRLHG